MRVTAKVDYAVRAAMVLADAAAERRRAGQGRAHRHRAGHPGEVPREHPERAAPGRHRAQPARRRRRLLAGRPADGGHRSPTSSGPSRGRWPTCGASGPSRSTTPTAPERCRTCGSRRGPPAIGARSRSPWPTSPTGSTAEDRRQTLVDRSRLAGRRAEPAAGFTSRGRPTPGDAGARCRSWCRRRGRAARSCRRAAGTASCRSIG